MYSIVSINTGNNQLSFEEGHVPQGDKTQTYTSTAALENPKQTP
jgi:hypothetical protein